MASVVKGGIGIEPTCELVIDFTSSMIQDLAVGSKAESIKNDGYQGNESIQEPSEEASVGFEVQPGLLGDWRFNAAVIEAICERLSLEDLKAARRVCKPWATAGAVPLSKKSKITELTEAPNFGRSYYAATFLDEPFYRTYSGISLPRLKKILYCRNSVVFETGFWIRHAELDWNLQDGKPWGTDSEVLESWLAVLNCEEIKLLISLKFENCPSEIVCKLFIPHYLPTRWKNLKLLEFNHSQLYGMKGVNLDLPDQLPAPTMIELESFGLDFDATFEYNFGILKYCSKLQSLKLGARANPIITNPWGKTGAEAEINNLLSSYNQIQAAIEGKRILYLELWPDYNFLEFFGTVSDAWKAFFSQLITSVGSSIEHLNLATVVEVTRLGSVFDDLPHLPQLKSCKLICQIEKTFTYNADRIRSFNNLFSVLASKGYLGVGDLLLDLLLQNSRITFSSQNAERATLQANNGVEDLLDYLSQGFPETMKHAYPDINYVCSPSQTATVDDVSSKTTAVFERLGKEGVFNVAMVAAEWNSLKLPKPFKLRFGEFEISGCLESFWKNSLSRNNGIEVQQPQNIRNPKGVTILCFDTIENLPEVWAKAQNSYSSWSSIPTGFTPAVVLKDTGSYAFARIFENGSLDGIIRDSEIHSKIWNFGAVIVKFSKRIWKRMAINI